MFTKMERKEKPKVPAKPRTLSVAEKARYFDRVLAEVTQVIGIKSSLSESDIKEADMRTNFAEATDGISQIIDTNDADITESFMK